MFCRANLQCAVFAATQPAAWRDEVYRVESAPAIIALIAARLRIATVGAGAFDVAVLEVVGSTAAPEEIFERETRWKEHLGTRAKGLNRN